MAKGLTITQGFWRKNNKDSSSDICSKSLFNVSSIHSRCDTKGNEKDGEVEVEQEKGNKLTPIEK